MFTREIPCIGRRSLQVPRTEGLPGCPSQCVWELSFFGRFLLQKKGTQFTGRSISKTFTTYIYILCRSMHILMYIVKLYTYIYIYIFPHPENKVKKQYVAPIHTHKPLISMIVKIWWLFRWLHGGGFMDDRNLRWNFGLETQALSSLESSGSGPTCKEGRGGNGGMNGLGVIGGLVTVGCFQWIQ